MRLPIVIPNLLASLRWRSGFRDFRFRDLKLLVISSVLRKFAIFVLIFSILHTSYFILHTSVYAQSGVERYQEIQKKIAETQAKIEELQKTERDLSEQIAYINSQIKLTELRIEEAQARIDQLEKEIGVLNFRIDYITDSVVRLEKLLKQRIIATYQQGFVSNLEILITSIDFSDLILRLQYLREVQEQDKKLLASLQLTKSNYANQKDDREDKQAQIEEAKAKLDAAKTLLDNQKREKDAFLAITKNDEARYQGELRRLQADAASIARALGNVGAVIGEVERGQRIASVGNSGCSTGPHLHLEVMTNARVENGQVIGRENKVDPKPYLDNGTFYKVLDNYDGKSWTEGGSITTYFNEFYNIFGRPTAHTGLDIRAPFGAPIYAAESGTAYFSSDTSPCFLTETVGKGIVVDHKNGLVTLYWHIP